MRMRLRKNSNSLPRQENTKPHKVQTSIHFAARKLNEKALKLLLEQGADCQRKDKAGRRPIHNCVNQSDKRKIKAIENCLRCLIHYGADVNAVDSNGDSALHYAVFHDLYEIVVLLVTHGAIVDIMSELSPFHYAVGLGRLEIMKYLFSSGANIEIVAEDGWRPIHSAATRGVSVKVDEEVEVAALKYLIDQGADIEAVTDDGETVMHIAAEYGDTHILDVLFEHGLSLKQKNYRGETPLHYCARYHKLAILKWFISKGVEINVKDDLGHTPLCHVSKAFVYRQPHHIACLELLLNSGATVKPLIKAGVICEKDVEIMKSYKVQDSITLYSVFVGTNQEPICGELKLIDFQKLFTDEITAGLMHERLKFYERREKLMAQAKTQNPLSIPASLMEKFISSLNVLELQYMMNFNQTA